MHAFIARTGSLVPAPPWLPTPMNLRVERSVRRLERILFAIIAERRRSGEDRGDLLSMLLHAQDEESGRRMTDRQLRDECMTLFLAGHETTANTMAWAWFLLSGRPDVEARLHDELDRVLDGRSPTVADLPRLPLHRVDHQRDLAPLSGRLDDRPRVDRAPGARRLPSPSGYDGIHDRLTRSSATRDGSTTPTPSGPSDGPTASCSGSPDTPTSPSAAARGSASAITSP